MIRGAHIVARVLAVLLAGAVIGFVGATGNRVVAQEPEATQWKGADYSSLSRFIEALEEERYTGLIFKRISSELARGRTLASLSKHPEI